MADKEEESRKSVSSFNSARGKISTGRRIDYGEVYNSPNRISSVRERPRSVSVMATLGSTRNQAGSGGIADNRANYRETSWSPKNSVMPELQRASLARPTLENYSSFTAPTWNRREIAANAQEIAGPSIRQLREATNRAMITGGSQNPNVSRMTYREALQGYGAGLGGVLSGARSAAVGEYTQKYGKDFEAAKISHEADLSSTAERNLQKSRSAELEYRTQSDNNMRTYTNLFDAWKKQGTSTTKSYKK